MKNLSPFDRKLTFGLFGLFLAFIVLLSTSFAADANKALTISLKGSTFTPSELIVSPGQTVTWINNDSAAHTIAGSQNDWESGNINPGSSFSLVFKHSGTYSYNFKQDPEVTGLIKVTG